MKRLFIPSLALFMAVGFLVGWNCSAHEEYTCRAMYVPFGEGSYVMVDQEQNHVFTVTMPKKIYGLSGEKITPDQLQKGNILAITGDGERLLTFPEQYPGVTKIRVVEEGAPQDADQYQHIVDRLYSEPDPSEPPSLRITYTTKLDVYPTKLAYCVFVIRGGYQWSWISDEATGEKQSDIACGPHILEWDKINEADLAKTEQMKLLFSKQPDSVQVERWPESQKGNPSAESERVEVRQKDDSWFIDGEPGYIYGIYGTWADGNVEYALVTKLKK